MDPVSAIVVLDVASFGLAMGASFVARQCQKVAQGFQARKGWWGWYAGVVALLLLSFVAVLVAADIANRAGSGERLVFAVMAVFVLTMVGLGGKDSHLRIFWVMLVVFLAVTVSIILTPYFLNFLPSWHFLEPRLQV